MGSGSTEHPKIGGKKKTQLYRNLKSTYYLSRKSKSLRHPKIKIRNMTPRGVFCGKLLEDVPQQTKQEPQRDCMELI